jgi:hypothetical protein
MTYKMNKKEHDNVVLLPGLQRYNHFVARAADWQEIWTLKAPDGYVLFGNDEGQECVPVWPHPDYALALAKDSWSNCTPECIDIESFMTRWLPSMAERKQFLAVFPTSDQKGVVVEPARLQKDLTEELRKIE